MSLDFNSGSGLTTSPPTLCDEINAVIDAGILVGTVIINQIRRVIMCNRHSFIVTRSGKVFDGLGLTDSHTTIRELACLSPEDDTVNAYEWQPPTGWPDADWATGLVKDVEVFDIKAKHLNAMRHHIMSLYPTMEVWKYPDKIHGTWNDAVTEIKGGLTVPVGENFSAEFLIEAGSVYAYKGSTVTLPALTEAGYVTAREGSTVYAPNLKK